MAPSENTYVQRLKLRSAASGVIEVGSPGILCVGVVSEDGTPPLLLIVDEGAANKGTSATNACERVLAYLDESWRGTFPVREANVVEYDSDGSFDHVQIQWGGHGDPQVGWKPLRWAGVEPRTKGAFFGMFGAQARRAVMALGSLAPAGLSSEATGFRE
jgi:hypothetical protein